MKFEQLSGMRRSSSSATRSPWSFANNPLVRRTPARSAHWPKLAGLMKLPESSVAR
jgi:hypothetical protein